MLVSIGEEMYIFGLQGTQFEEKHTTKKEKQYLVVCSQTVKGCHSYREFFLGKYGRITDFKYTVGAIFIVCLP